MSDELQDGQPCDFCGCLIQFQDSDYAVCPNCQADYTNMDYELDPGCTYL